MLSRRAASLSVTLFCFWPTSCRYPIVNLFHKKIQKKNFPFFFLTLQTHLNKAVCSVKLVWDILSHDTRKLYWHGYVTILYTLLVLCLFRVPFQLFLLCLYMSTSSSYLRFLHLLPWPLSASLFFVSYIVSLSGWVFSWWCSALTRLHHFYLRPLCTQRICWTC